MNSAPLFCLRCGVELKPGRGDFYVVKIEAVADPSPPDITAEDLQRDRTAEIERLIEKLRRLSPQEALDQVYRKLTLHLCLPCYSAWIENPAGR
ncbi:MAG: hypothetical protein AB1716_19705 [Planctomycetota bacterium]